MTGSFWGRRAESRLGLVRGRLSGSSVFRYAERSQSTNSDQIPPAR